MIVSFKNYYWKDTLAELTYHPPAAGARECWVDVSSQAYAMSYSKGEMGQMLKDGLIVAEMPGYTGSIEPPEPTLTVTKASMFEDDETAAYAEFVNKDVVIVMKEGYEIYGHLAGVEPGSSGMLVLVEVVIYDPDEPTPASGEAALLDPKHMASIREMSPEEERQWIKDYTIDLSSEEIDVVVNMFRNIKGKEAPNATKNKKETKKKEAKKADTKKEYSVDLVNTDIHPDQIAEKLSIALTKEDRPALTILFHGQPGTSKSQTAKYITDKIGKEIKSYNLGEIMSKWVGETEKKINEIFEDAKENGHVVLIDEIEGLTQDRSGAEKSWQMTHVNSFLQAIDEFDGIVICTTNFTDTMDKAFLRRFLLKAEFKNMTSEQAKKAAKKFFPKLRFRKAFEDDMYAPADFANIKNGFLFLKEEDITAKYVWEQLEKEAKTRRIAPKHAFSACMDDSARMGFNLKKKG